jgi:hypothetical protein
LDELQRLTGWGDDRVLYFGDHPYADLADLVTSHFKFLTFLVTIEVFFLERTFVTFTAPDFKTFKVLVCPKTRKSQIRDDAFDISELMV